MTEGRGFVAVFFTARGGGGGGVHRGVLLHIVCSGHTS
jgi:hypothetical protein